MLFSPLLLLRFIPNLRAVKLKAGMLYADYRIFVWNGGGFTLTQTIQDDNIGGAMYFSESGSLISDKTYGLNQ